jgi:hypothetical protein
MTASKEGLMVDNNNNGWLVVTAGLGSPAFREAAERVAKSAEILSGVSRVVKVTDENLQEVCPRTSERFKEYQSPDFRGFGFMTYKSEVVHRALSGFWGEFLGVVWIDAGCEVYVNPISNHRFKNFKLMASKFGGAVFSLDTPEVYFTKQTLFQRFPELDPSDRTPQIQTTFFFLAGEKGLRIAEKWLEITLERIEYSDESLSVSGEVPNFQTHRHDQSIFSLVCKSEGVRPLNYTPATGTNSLIGKIRALSHPIWVSRNRTGKSVIPKFLQRLSNLH